MNHMVELVIVFICLERISVDLKKDGGSFFIDWNICYCEFWIAAKFI